MVILYHTYLSYGTIGFIEKSITHQLKSLTRLWLRIGLSKYLFVSIFDPIVWGNNSVTLRRYLDFSNVPYFLCFDFFHFSSEFRQRSKKWPKFHVTAVEQLVNFHVVASEKQGAFGQESKFSSHDFSAKSKFDAQNCVLNSYNHQTLWQKNSGSKAINNTLSFSAGSERKNVVEVVHHSSKLHSAV